MADEKNINLSTKSFAWVREDKTKALVAAFGAECCRFVGGAVRDSLIGRLVQDVDLATSLAPEEVMARLKKAGIKVVPTGLKHGTVTAVCQGRAFEVTTLRHDVETYGRHAEVKFHDDWAADAARRDFTINALYLGADGTLYDYFGGEEDIEAGRVRFIGDAAKRITEDALRILRFFRFHAWYGKGDLDPGGLKAVAEKLGLLDVLSEERVRDEILKLLRAPDPVPVVAVMVRAGVLQHVFPGRGFDLKKLEAVVALENELDRVSALRRLAALVALDKPGALEVSARLKLSNRQRSRLTTMVTVPLPSNLTEVAVRRDIYLNGLESFCDRLVLNGGEAQKIKPLLDFADGFKVPKFPVGGGDLRRAGIPPGIKMGETLKALEARWLDSDFILSKDQLLKYLD